MRQKVEGCRDGAAAHPIVMGEICSCRYGTEGPSGPTNQGPRTVVFISLHLQFAARPVCRASLKRVCVPPSFFRRGGVTGGGKKDKGRFTRE